MIVPGRRLSAVVLSAAVLTAAGAGTWSWAAARAARGARLALAAGRHGEARERALSWLRLRPRSADADYVLARAALALGRPEEFREACRRALAEGLSPMRRALLRALMDVRGGRFAGAEPALLAAVAAGEGPDPQIDEALARVYLETFRLGSAEPVLDRWAAEAPGDPRPYLWRAEIDRRIGRGPEALEADFRRALGRDPGSPAARLGLADALRESRRHAEARSEYDAYLGLRPGDPAGHLGAAEAALALGDEAGAARHLDRCLALDPRNAEALKQIARAAARRGDFPAALACIDRAAELAPDELGVRHTRTLILHRLGRRDDAAKEQAVVRRLRSEYARLDELKDGLLRSPGDDDLKAQIGRWMLDHGHDEEGRRWSEEVLRRRPEHLPSNANMALYHERRGEAAIANYYRARAGEPDR